MGFEIAHFISDNKVRIPKFREVASTE